MKRTLTRNRTIGGVTLDDLPGMSRAELLDTWAQVVGKPPVLSASRELLVNTIAWHLQARQFGGLTPSVQRKLERLAAAIDAWRARPPAHRDRSPPPRHDPGADMARRDPYRHRPGGRVRLSRPALPQPVADRAAHHRHPLEWPGLLRAPAG